MNDTRASTDTDFEVPLISAIDAQYIMGHF